jgi:hypothetical protein
MSVYYRYVLPNGSLDEKDDAGIGLVQLLLNKDVIECAAPSIYYNGVVGHLNVLNHQSSLQTWQQSR